MIKALYVTEPNEYGQHYSTYAVTLEDAIRIFKAHNVSGRCKEIGTDYYTEIE